MTRNTYEDVCTVQKHNDFERQTGLSILLPDTVTSSNHHEVFWRSLTRHFLCRSSPRNTRLFPGNIPLFVVVHLPSLSDWFLSFYNCLHVCLDVILKFSRDFFSKLWKWNVICSICFCKWFWFWGSEMNPVRHDPEPCGPMVEMRTFNRLTWSFCTFSSKPATSVLVTGVQSPNPFSDPRILIYECRCKRCGVYFSWYVGLQPSLGYVPLSTWDVRRTPCDGYGTVTGMVQGSTRLTYTGLFGELKHLKIKTRWEVCECDGWVCILVVIEVPSRLRLTRTSSVVPRIFADPSFKPCSTTIWSSSISCSICTWVVFIMNRQNET
jgi:hypothetical protein